MMRKYLLLFLAIVSNLVLQAQPDVEMADVMRSNGKIYVVVGVVLIILLGFFAYLIRLDRKVGKIEGAIKEEYK